MSELLYAWRTDRPPAPGCAAAGCPQTGWVHESAPPWRVIVSADRANLAPTASFEVVEYDGDEATVDLLKLLKR
jgi:hypothetical protein